MKRPFDRFESFTDDGIIRHFFATIVRSAPSITADGAKDTLVKVFENTENSKLICLAESIQDGLWDHLFLTLEDENIFGPLLT